MLKKIAENSGFQEEHIDRIIQNIASGIIVLHSQQCPIIYRNICVFWRIKTNCFKRLSQYMWAVMVGIKLGD